MGLIVVLGLAFLAVNEIAGTSSGDVVIDGIKCGGMVNNGYHVHAHLAIFNQNKQVFVPPKIGSSKYGCFYQLHNHGRDGIIHIKGRDKISPTLGTWLDIWGQPLSRTRILFLKMRRGERMTVYVDRKVFTGNPRVIKLRRHETIAVEIGPPFHTPLRYTFPPGLKYPSRIFHRATSCYLEREEQDVFCLFPLTAPRRHPRQAFSRCRTRLGATMWPLIELTAYAPVDGRGSVAMLAAVTAAMQSAMRRIILCRPSSRGTGNRTDYRRRLVLHLPQARSARVRHRLVIRAR